jgi:hypothetical protein
MRIRGIFAMLLTLLVVVLVAGPKANADRGKDHVKAHDGVIGFLEVPAISTAATGTFEATIDDDDAIIRFTLTYTGLTAAATQAHIHLGQRSVNGGIVAFLCGGDTKPACPAGTTDQALVTGTIAQADIVGLVGQGITARADFEEVLAALRAGRIYANVHNASFPGGEIRGQVNDANQRDDR